MSERQTKFPDLDKHLAEMRVLQQSASAHHGYLSYLTTHKSVYEKYGDSFTGHLVKLQIDAVITSSIMLFCSLWDRNGHSIPEFAKAISDKADHIKLQRREWRSNWSEDMLGLSDIESRLQDFCDSVSEIAQSPEALAIRIHRDEEIAHPLKGRSAQRRKFEKAFGRYEPAKYEDLITLLGRSAEFVSEARSLWHFEIYDHKDVSDWFKRYSETYWKTMPKYSDVE